MVDAGELGPYLHAVWGWQDVRQIGWVRRRPQVRRNAPWNEQWVTLVTSLATQHTAPADLFELVRGHWIIENRVHRVRDVSFDEDRSHGRLRGQLLAWVRNTTISFFRWRGFRYAPDGWRITSAHLPVSLS
ncbi:MAG: hypothetical protein NVS2B7_38150 [Herpetosiphon sp.]